MPGTLNSSQPHSVTNPYTSNNKCVKRTNSCDTTYIKILAKSNSTSDNVCGEICSSNEFLGYDTNVNNQWRSHNNGVVGFQLGSTTDSIYSSANSQSITQCQQFTKEKKGIYFEIKNGKCIAYDDQGDTSNETGYMNPDNKCGTNCWEIPTKCYPLTSTSNCPTNYYRMSTSTSSSLTRRNLPGIQRWRGTTNTSNEVTDTYIFRDRSYSFRQNIGSGTTTDQTCRQIRGCGSTAYELTPATFTSDRVCTRDESYWDSRCTNKLPAVTDSSRRKYPNQPFNEISNPYTTGRVCRDPSPKCSSDKYETTELNISATQDRVCRPLTTCSGNTPVEGEAPKTKNESFPYQNDYNPYTSDRTCTTANFLGVGETCSSTRLNPTPRECGTTYDSTHGTTDLLCRRRYYENLNATPKVRSYRPDADRAWFRDSWNYKEWRNWDNDLSISDYDDPFQNECVAKLENGEICDNINGMNQNVYKTDVCKSGICRWFRDNGQYKCASSKLTGGEKCANSNQIISYGTTPRPFENVCEGGENACKLNSSGGKTCARGNGLDDGCATVNASGAYAGYCENCKDDHVRGSELGYTSWPNSEKCFPKDSNRNLANSQVCYHNNNCDSGKCLYGEYTLNNNRCINWTSTRWYKSQGDNRECRTAGEDFRWCYTSTSGAWEKCSGDWSTRTKKRCQP